MSDTNSGDDKTLNVTPKKTLTLKRPGIEQSTVRQNFSHGRTKSVVVETKRKFVKPGEQAAPAAQSVFTPKPAAPAPQRRKVRKTRTNRETSWCWRPPTGRRTWMRR